MLIAVFLLLALGITVIYTSSLSLALQQLLFAGVGMIFYFLLRSFDYRSLKSFLKIGYLIVFALLIITFIVGISTRGSVRWIPLGLFNLQPSEFAKPLIILILAHFWSKNLPSWRNIGISFLIVLPIAGLVFRQPDLGTALTIMFIWLSLLIASNISHIKILILSLVTFISLPLSWFLLHDYQKKRIISFLNPSLDPQGIGFHVIQSTIAVGSGEIFGRGLGSGTQSRLQFLPEFRTDFVFAFIAEELGFMGSSIVLVLYIVIFFFLLKNLSKIKDRFGELVIIGVISMLFIQISVNVAMNIGLLPITGITLPLLSYGGSSIVTTLICLGLVSSVSRYGVRRDRLDEVDNFIL